MDTYGEVAVEQEAGLAEDFQSSAGERREEGGAIVLFDSDMILVHGEGDEGEAAGAEVFEDLELLLREFQHGWRCYMRRE